jgi:hypothetical protein
LEFIKVLRGRFKPSTQADYVQKLDPKHKQGVCFALSTMLLSRYGKLRIDNDMFEKKTFGEILKDPKMRVVIEQLQQRISSKTQTAALIRPTVEAAKARWQAAVDSKDNAGAEQAFAERSKIIDDVYDVFGFDALVLDTIRTLGQRHVVAQNGVAASPSPFTTLIDFVATTKGRHLIRVPHHAIAAINDPTGGEHGLGKFKFYDPNWGQAIFDDSLAFKLFLSSFFRDPDIVRIYGLSQARLSVHSTSL